MVAVARAAAAAAALRGHPKAVIDNIQANWNGFAPGIETIWRQ